MAAWIGTGKRRGRCGSRPANVQNGANVFVEVYFTAQALEKDDFLGQHSGKQTKNGMHIVCVLTEQFQADMNGQFCSTIFGNGEEGARDACRQQPIRRASRRQRTRES